MVQVIIYSCIAQSHQFQVTTTEMMHQIIKTLFDAHVVMQMLWDRLAQIIQCNASVAARRPLRRTCNMKIFKPF